VLDGKVPLGLHLNVMALGEVRPGVQASALSRAAALRLDELNLWTHSLLFHGLWVDRAGLVTSVPSPELHLYLELPEVQDWPTIGLVQGTRTAPHLSWLVVQSAHCQC
jgi:hypothetical protein